jgi:hypothetical protein
VDKSSPELFNDLRTEPINCCETIRPNRKVLGKSLRQKIKLKQGDVETRVSCNLTAMLWKDKINTNKLANMLSLPAESNSYEEHGKSLKLAIV